MDEQSPQLLTERERKTFTDKTLKRKATQRLLDRSKFSSRVAGRFTGTVHVLCPACGLMIKGQIRESWKIKCTNAKCQKIYGVGLAVWVLGMGTQHEPMDRFPEACVEQYDRETVNRVMDAEQSNNGLGAQATDCGQSDEQSARPSARVDGTGEDGGQEPRAKRAGSEREGLW